ncbi:MAG: Lin0512 family protein [Chloroflexi bacterium]|nr:Lin0512 family protein [Chloroflexota bacterium]
MALKKCLLEMGTGVDLHDRDYTKAARRAVENALWHNSLPFVRSFGGGDWSRVHVHVLIGSPNPGAVDGGQVLAMFSVGQKSIQVVRGGLEVPSEDGSDATVMSNAAITVSLDV